VGRNKKEEGSVERANETNVFKGIAKLQKNRIRINSQQQAKVEAELYNKFSYIGSITRHKQGTMKKGSKWRRTIRRRRRSILAKSYCCYCCC